MREIIEINSFRNYVYTLIFMTTGFINVPIEILVNYGFADVVNQKTQEKVVDVNINIKQTRGGLNPLAQEFVLGQPEETIIETTVPSKSLEQNTIQVEPDYYDQTPSDYSNQVPSDYSNQIPVDYYDQAIPVDQYEQYEQYFRAMQTMQEYYQRQQLVNGVQDFRVLNNVQNAPQYSQNNILLRTSNNSPNTGVNTPVSLWASTGFDFDPSFLDSPDRRNSIGGSSTSSTKSIPEYAKIQRVSLEYAVEKTSRNNGVPIILPVNLSYSNDNWQMKQLCIICGHHSINAGFVRGVNPVYLNAESAELQTINLITVAKNRRYGEITTGIKMCKFMQDVFGIIDRTPESKNNILARIEQIKDADQAWFDNNRERILILRELTKQAKALGSVDKEEFAEVKKKTLSCEFEYPWKSYKGLEYSLKLEYNIGSGTWKILNITRVNIPDARKFMIGKLTQ